MQYDLRKDVFQLAMRAFMPKTIFPIWLKKIELLLDNPNLRKEMGDFGRMRVLKDLNWDVEAPKYLSVFKSLDRS
ncbi:MAG: hypothetical protein U5J82_03430 [Desulfobacterales bacterium]|nr:hypothetical protein [Desulfobacterales bacterium]